MMSHKFSLWICLMCFAISYQALAGRQIPFFFHYGTWGTSVAGSNGVPGWCSLYLHNVGTVTQKIEVEMILEALGAPGHVAKFGIPAQPGCLSTTLSVILNDATNSAKVDLPAGCVAIIYKEFDTSKAATGLPACRGKVKINEDRGAVVAGLMRYEIPERLVTVACKGTGCTSFDSSTSSLYGGGGMQINGGRPF